MGHSGLVQPGSPPPDVAAVRLRQIGIIVAGVIAAAAMLMLGWWQAEVYQTSGTDASRERASQPALALDQVAPVGVRPTEAFGRTVTFSGSYDPESQILVPDPGEPGRFRVLTALVRDDGTAVAVVRGVWTGPAEQAPPPPAGRLEQQGLLLPSEPSDTTPVPVGQLSTVRISVLAQQWRWPLVAGVVTLEADDSAGQGLVWEQPELPREGGELRNGAYAIQWWVFAAFALVLAGKIARDIGRPVVEDAVPVQPAVR